MTHLVKMNANKQLLSFIYPFISGDRIWVGFVLWIRFGSGKRGLCISAVVASPWIEAKGTWGGKCCTSISRPIQLGLKISQDTTESSSCTTDRSSVEYCMFYFAEPFSMSPLCTWLWSNLCVSPSLNTQKLKLCALKQQNWARRIPCVNSFCTTYKIRFLFYGLSS